MTKYIPIACQFHDILELNASRNALCTITYFDSDKKVRTLKGVIADIFAKEKEEFLKLTDGTLIRLDKILSVNDTRFYGHCS